MVNYTNPNARPPTASQSAYIDGFNNMMDSLGLRKTPPPPSPMELAEQDIYKNGGDTDYELDQNYNFYTSGAGKKAMDDYYANYSDWYNPDGTRNRDNMTTLEKDSADYLGGTMGPSDGNGAVNPIAVALREFDPTLPSPVGTGVAGSAASEAGNGGTIGNPIPHGGSIGNPTPTPTQPPPTPVQAPTPVHVSEGPRPSIIQEQAPQNQQQQQQMAAALRSPNERFASKPQQNSSWQAGGWG